MSCFKGFNTENKLRISLSAYTAQIIENDCMNFSQKKTTLINTVIMNYYQHAVCSISLQIKREQENLMQCLSTPEKVQNDSLIEKILMKRKHELKELYAKRYPADVHWQITLNKRVKRHLTMDPHSQEELYYGERPGHYVRALLEEYAQLPYYRREAIIFQDLIHKIEDAISAQNAIKLTNIKGTTLYIKPYKITTDPFSTYHYVIGYHIPASKKESDIIPVMSNVLSIRLSRLTDAEIQYYTSGLITEKEELQIKQEIKEKGVQFVSGNTTAIKVWLSDVGIKKYHTQLHLRPIGTPDPLDEHTYTFSCTEAQVTFYFFGFGKEAKIISPASLAEEFKIMHKDAAALYEE